MWCTPKFLDGLNYEFKDENNGKKMSWAHSLARNTSEVEGCARAPGWGLRRLKSNSITHMDLHKPNNNVVSA